MPPRGAKRKCAEEVNEDHYAKAADLPEERRRVYDTILEDFDKQVASKIADNETALHSLQNQIRSLFRVGKLQIQKTERSMIFEDMFKSESEPPRLSMQLAAVKATVESAITTKVMGIEIKPPKSSMKSSAVKAKRTSRKASTAAPVTATRQSARKRTTKTSYADFFETPLVGKPRASKAAAVALQTPSTVTAGGMPIITPKFNMATPLIRSAMRAAKPNEMLVSLSGSPVYAGASTIAKSRAKKTTPANTDLVSVPLGKGMTLMLPTSSPTAANVDPSLDLDEDAKRRLVALRSQIDSMLQFRANK